MLYLARQVVFFAVALWLAATLTYFLPQLLGQPLSYDFPNDYYSYLGGLLHFDLGYIDQNFELTSVSSIIGSALPWTVLLVGIATIIAFLIGTGLGIVSAWRGGAFDHLLTPVLMLCSAMPYFFIAMIVVYVFTIILPWFPYHGAQSTTAYASWHPGYIGDVLNHAVLPVASLVIATIGLWWLPMRNSMLGTLHEEYITMARVKGLRARRIMLAYAARNAILPPLSGLAVQLGIVISGNFLVEDVFNYPGVGLLLLNSIINHNYPVMQGIIMLTAVVTLVANLIADLASLRLDPRIRRS